MSYHLPQALIVTTIFKISYKEYIHKYTEYIYVYIYTYIHIYVYMIYNHISVCASYLLINGYQYIPRKTVSNMYPCVIMTTKTPNCF